MRNAYTQRILIKMFMMFKIMSNFARKKKSSSFVWWHFLGWEKNLHPINVVYFRGHSPKWLYKRRACWRCWGACKLKSIQCVFFLSRHCLVDTNSILIALMHKNMNDCEQWLHLTKHYCDRFLFIFYGQKIILIWSAVCI